MGGPEEKKFDHYERYGYEEEDLIPACISGARGCELGAGRRVNCSTGLD